MAQHNISKSFSSDIHTNRGDLYSLGEEKKHSTYNYTLKMKV